MVLWEDFDGFALCNECLEVLEGVIRDWLAFVLVLSDHLSVALEVSWEDLSTVLDGFHMGWESGLEDLVNLHSVSDLVVESLVVLLSWLGEDHVVPEVEVVVSRVNSELVLSPFLSLVQLEKILLDVLLAVVLELLPVANLLGILSRLKVSDWLIGEGELTPLKNMGLGSLLLNSLELILEGLDVHLSLVGILEPVDREKISKAGSDGFSIDLIIWRAVSSP